MLLEGRDEIEISSKYAAVALGRMDPDDNDQ